MADPFDAYYHWLGIPPEEQPPDYYRLLGLRRFEANADVIQAAADRQMGHLRTFQAGRHSQQSQRVLNEVAAAKVCLLNAAKKADYDARLRAELPPATPAASAPAGEATGEVADGSVFGEYLLLDRLGGSASGGVYKAKHRTMGRVVALKILSPEALNSPEALARFRRKVRILAQLSHPNLVTAYDAGRRAGTHYLIMEYVDGKDLRSLVKENGPLPVGDAVRYAAQAAAGLGYAHAHGVIHRNLKPSNLLVDRQGVVKVIGLGLARVEREAVPEEMSFGEEMTARGRVMGTFDYMAPEQALDSTRVDARTDVYALGCTLCTLLEGRPPYLEKSRVKKILAHRDAPIPSLFELRPEVPFALDALFHRMLAKRPEDRPQSMEEVIAGLSSVV
jgi:serine/threonine protein kinase